MINNFKSHWHETVRDRIRDLDQQIDRLTRREALTHTLRSPADEPTKRWQLDDALGFRHDQASNETSITTGTDRARCCKACERPLRHSRTGRPRSYCSRACRQRACRARTRLRRAPS
jgi:hypothetical protein